MKICCIAPRFIPSMGKAITFVSRGLAERGHEVTVISSNLDHSNRPVQEEKERVENVKAIRLKAYPFAKKLIIPNLIPHLATVDADAFYLEGFGHLETILASWFSRFRNIPSFIRADWGGSPIISSGWKGLYDRFVKFPTLRNVSVISVFSKKQKRMMANLGIDSKKIIVMPNGVDYERFANAKENDYLRKKFGIPKKDKIMLCIVSRMIPFKNLELAIETVSQINDLSLVILGSKTDRNYYQKLLGLIQKLKLEGGVFFHSEVPHDQIHKIYSGADIFALPSKPEEGMNLSTLEAMTSGLPVVTNRVSVTPDWILEANSGFVADSEKGFIFYVEKLVKDRKLRERMGRNGKKYMRDYSWDRIVDRIERILIEEISV